MKFRNFDKLYITYPIFQKTQINKHFIDMTVKNNEIAKPNRQIVQFKMKLQINENADVFL